MSALAEMERGIIAERAKDIHKDRRERGVVWGVDIGPKQVVSPILREKVLVLRKLGYSYKNIADTLNRQGIETPRGKSWYPSSVKNILDATTGDSNDLPEES
jgi:DNA invertase Pin-like site-specific DNA recombinase